MPVIQKHGEQWPVVQSCPLEDQDGIWVRDGGRRYMATCTFFAGAYRCVMVRATK